EHVIRVGHKAALEPTARVWRREMTTMPNVPRRILAAMKPWEFWIDVGGTFTDCIARSPDDRLIECKVLSSGITKRRVGEVLGPVRLCDASAAREPPGFWTGYELRFLDAQGQPFFASRIEHYDSHTGGFTTAALLPEGLEPGTAFELSSGEESPILAIRTVLG